MASYNFKGLYWNCVADTEGHAEDNLHETDKPPPLSGVLGLS